MFLQPKKEKIYIGKRNVIEMSLTGSRIQQNTHTHATNMKKKKLCRKRETAKELITSPAKHNNKKTYLKKNWFLSGVCLCV